jgi:hypothetical protein
MDAVSGGTAFSARIHVTNRKHRRHSTHWARYATLPFRQTEVASIQGGQPMIGKSVKMATAAVLGLALVAWSIRPRDASGQHAKWEYKYVKMTAVELMGTDSAVEQSIIQLNRLGDDGWELISIQPKHDPLEGSSIQVVGTAHGSQTTTDRQFDCYFKRQK